MKRITAVRAVLTCAILLAATAVLPAQMPSTGSISGTVADPSGGAVSAAKHKATEQKTKREQSTLADAGRILVDGVNLQPGSPKESRRCGIGMVFQHFTLIPSMTVAENLVLPRPDLPLVIDWKTEFTRLREFLKSAPFRVELDSRICTLSAGQKQKVEILKEIYLETRFLILDEPNSVLTPQEAGEVLGLLRCMVDRKELSVLLITHKFCEVHAFCQTVTVLRRGRVAGEGKVSQLDSNRMAEMMMGKTGAAHKVGKTAKPGGPLLCLEGLVAMGDTGIEA